MGLKKNHPCMKITELELSVRKHQGKRVATNHKETEVLPQKPSSISPSNLPQRRTFFLKQFYWDPIEILFWEWLLSTFVTVLHISIRVDLGQDGSSLCVAKLKAHRYVCGDSITNCRKSTYLKTWQLEPNMQNQTQWKSRGPILLSLVIGQRRGQWQELKTYLLTVSWVWEYTAGTPSIRKYWNMDREKETEK